MGFNIMSLVTGPADDQQQKAQTGGTPDRLRVKYIHINDIVPSDDNFYSMDGIDDLKRDILLAGRLTQNLTVTILDNGKFKLLAGHRRRLAILSLIDDGETQFSMLPCDILQPHSDPDIQALNEKIIIISSNSTREKTHWDKVQEAQRMADIIAQYKKQNNVPGKVRELLSKATGESETQLARYFKIANGLIPDFQVELKENRLGITVAEKLAGLPQEQQTAAHKLYTNSGLSIHDVEKLEAATKPAPPVPPAIPDTEGVPEELPPPHIERAHQNHGDRPTDQRPEPTAAAPPAPVSAPDDATPIPKKAPPPIPEPTAPPAVRVHDLKTWPQPFDAMAAGLKLWEYRRNDRAYTVGDVLHLMRFDPEQNQYTGETLDMTVVYMLDNEASLMLGVPEGYVIMSVKQRSEANGKE